MYEYVTRACVIGYLHTNEGKRAAERRIRWDERAGFTGIGALAETLISYENNRDVYPDLDAFLPEIATFFEQYTASLH